VTDDRNLSAVDGNHDHRMNERDDRNDLKTDASRGLHMIDLRLDVLDDRNLSAVDVNRGHHMSDLLDDLNLSAVDANRGHHMSDLHLDVTGDQKMDVMMDANRDHHENVKLDDLNLSAVDVNRGHHMSDLRLDAKILDVKMNCHRVIRKCALPALNDLSLGAK